MEKGGKSGEKHQKIRKKYEIVLKSVFFVVLGDFLGVWGGFWVFFRVFRGFLRKKWFWTAKTAGRPPLPPPIPCITQIYDSFLGKPKR